MNKHIYSLIIIFLLCGLSHPLSSQTPTVSFANWKDNKKAAYSIIHDDYSDYVTGIFQHADPIATARGIKLCFGAITNFCGTTEWANARTMIAHGHECINHSHNHLCGGSASQCSGLSTYGSGDFSTELGLSSQLIEANTGVKPRFFIHPYDASSEAIHSYLVGLGYLGARAGTQEAVNNNSFTDFFHLNYHVYSPSTPISSLNQAVDAAISAGGYAIREFHGVADGSWGAMTVQNYTNHLTYVKTQMDNGNIWSATTTEAITYKMQRDGYQPTATYTATNGTISVSFSNLTTIDPSVLRTPVTLNVNLNGLSGVYTALQNGAVIPSVRNGNIVSVNIYPHQGSVTLTCQDCSPTSTVPNVTGLTATAGATSALLNWVNPTTTFSNILVVAKEATGFLTKPTGNLYIANANFTGISSSFEGGKVVYQGKGTSVNVTNLTAGKTYFFRVYVLNGSAWSNGVETSASIASPSTPTLGCLKASYFNNINLSGTPIATRYEESVNYNWGTTAPKVTGITPNNFSIRWEGTFTAPVTGSYQFTTRTDDGVRLWVNNRLIINKWKDQSATSFSASIALVAGTNYTIKMEYYEKSGSASAQLSWKIPTQTNKIMLFSTNCGTLNSYQSQDLITLDGRIEKSKAMLQWVVNTQREIDYYQLEKRNEQGEFVPLIIVNDNNQAAIRLNSFIDENVTGGENIYRVQTYFLDNNIPPQYSRYLKINYAKPDVYNIFPNPAQNYIDIDLSEALGRAVDIHIFSMVGKELYNEKIEAAQTVPHHVGLNNFQTGQYLIQINIEGKRSVMRKLVVNY